jgi:hypothetical protein
MKQLKHPHNFNIADRHKPINLISFLLLKYLFLYHWIASNSIPPTLLLLPYEITTPSQWAEPLFTT